MEMIEIIESLKEGETDFLKTKSFSQQPGIYAFFYIGDDFPLLGDTVQKHQIIYIGKTESSQEKRDAKTHFSSGKTGSSTVRKSIGSILCAAKNLKPIPRNDNDYLKGRFSHFKFDNSSEEIITNWMKNNLALSFYEYPKSKQEIEDLETSLINELVPVLNISKNFKNPFKSKLEQLRKNCALIALKTFSNKEIKKEEKIILKQIKNTTTMSSSGKYIDLWAKNRDSIKNKLLIASTKQTIQLRAEDFKNVGNRNRYAFNLEYNDGVVSNNIGGSAVARDLAKVLENSSEVMTILKSGQYKINMDSFFCLWLEKLN